MKNNKIEDILNMIGVETIVICKNHNDKVRCHKVVNEEEEVRRKKWERK